jgi:hypothetical protein
MICGRRCAICWLSIRWLPSCCSPQPGAEDLEEARSFLQTMDQSAQRMAAMFDGLLQLNGLRAMCCSRSPWTCCLAVLRSVCRLRRGRMSGVCLLQRPCCWPILICWSRL